MQLTGCLALITGGRRIGAVVAEELARHGVDVAIADPRSHQQADDTASRVRAQGRRATIHQADLSQADQCTMLVREATRALGGLDILVNMASVYESRPFDQLQLSDWNAVIDVDLRASFLCAQAAVPHLRARGRGRIVNFTDWTAASRRPRYQGLLPYYIAKAGVIALTEALALELAGDQILVNAVAPGPILAPPEMAADEQAAVARSTPVGRWGGELEIAKAVLACLETDFITGETIRVDGGRHLK